MIYEAIDYWNSPSDSYLEHHGVKGMKWGVRKAYHNFQGRRYRRGAAKIQRDINSLRNAGNKTGMSKRDIADSISALSKIRDKQLSKAKQHENYQPKGLTKGQKIAIGVGVGAAVAVGAGVGIYMLKKNGGLSVNKMPKVEMNLAKSSFLKTKMKTPVANIQAGPSVMRNTIQKQQAGLLRKTYNKESINWGRAEALAARRHATNPAAAAKAYNNLHYLGYNSYGMKGQYSPRYVTNKGRQVNKRIVKAFGKPQVIQRRFY